MTYLAWRTELKETHVENPWYAIDFNTRKGTIRKLCDKDLNKQLVTPHAEWEMGEFIYEIIIGFSSFNALLGCENL